MGGFDLSNWKITLPIDRDGDYDGRAIEIRELEGYAHPAYFFYADDGALVFRAGAEGATTKGSKYSRSELREMDGQDRAFWTLDDGGVMSATLAVTEMPTYSNGKAGRIIIGQIHGEDDELVRLYYQDGQLYFKNEHAGPDDKELSFSFENENGQAPSVGLGEKFSYLIKAEGDTLEVSILADGDVYSSVTSINDVWQSDVFYFKAGVYMGVNDDNGSGNGEARFYALDFGHDDGEGFDGWDADMTGDDLPVADDDQPVDGDDSGDDGGDSDSGSDDHAPDQAEDSGSAAETFTKLSGDSGDNVLVGSESMDVIRGREGDDALWGHAGDDILWGNDGDDVLYGGLGKDWLRGGAGQDLFIYNSLAEGGDIIDDFRTYHDDRLDLSGLFNGVDGFDPLTALTDGYIQLIQHEGHERVHVKIDLDAGGGDYYAAHLLTLENQNVETVSIDSFILDPSAGENVTPEPGDQQADAALFYRDIAFETQGTTDNLIIRGQDALDDVLFGGYGDDTLKGYGGDDVLYGGAGDDILWGNDGDDVLYGGAGDDWVKGGRGVDTYVFESILDAGDHIVEFQDGEKLDVSGLIEHFIIETSPDVDMLVQDGYVSFKQRSDAEVEVYVDADGYAGGQGSKLLATLHTTQSGQDIDQTILLI